jgi:hypothetical protein
VATGLITTLAVSISFIGKRVIDINAQRYKKTLEISISGVSFLENLIFFSAFVG